MGLRVKIRVEENSKSVYIFDVTGKHAKPCNETGWGIPNKELKYATSAELHVYVPKSEVPLKFNLYPDFPNSDNVGYEKVPADFGMTKLISGVWRFDLLVRVFDHHGETMCHASCQKLFKKDVACCLSEGAVKANTENFESKEVVKSNNLWNLFRAAEDAASHGRVKEAQKIIDYLYTKCNCHC